MTNQHPITPPPELLEAWIRGANHNEPMFAQVAVIGAQWGSDQELEACCEYMQHEDFHGFAKELRAARRPKPPSLKKQALSLIPEVCGLPMMRTYSPDEVLIIRRAIEALPND